MAAGRGSARRDAENLRRRLLRLPAAMMAEIDKALDVSAREIQRDAMVAVPKDTGELSGAITVRETLEGITLRGINTRLARGRAEDIARFIGVFGARRGEPGWYAAFVEFGAAGRPAQPYLRPAYQANRRRANARIRRAVRKVTRQASRL